jgi:SAM-dependent methyltransferase
MAVILQDFHTHQSNLDESSGYTLAGSFTRDLIASKVWLLKELEQIQQHYTTMYILGSWYGNLALYMQLQPTIQVDRIINVEINPEMLDTSRNILDRVGAQNIKYMYKDANELDYTQLGDAGVVVNTSLTEMPEKEWFEHIPTGTLVALQARDQDPGVEYHSAQDIQHRYTLSQVLYHGSMRLNDPKTEYTRYMTIGTK